MVLRKQRDYQGIETYVKHSIFLKGEKMLTKRTMLLLTEIVLAIVVIGCTPTMVGTNGGVYQGCKMWAVSDKDVSTVYNSSVEALTKLELKVTDKMKDAFGAKVTAMSSDGKKITVVIKPTKDNQTMYSIKVGTLGDKERSEKIYTEIDNSLMGKK